MYAGSNVSITMRCGATRRISATPARQSDQWCIVSTASAASNEPSSNGSASAEAWTAGAAPGARCASITAEGSTATTSRSRGSYAPAAGADVDDAARIAERAAICCSMRGSGRRVRA